VRAKRVYSAHLVDERLRARRRSAARGDLRVRVGVGLVVLGIGIVAVFVGQVLGLVSVRFGPPWERVVVFCGAVGVALVGLAMAGADRGR
jgi:hypothetical protein